MESGADKLKIVWICHFMNNEVRDKLNADKKGKEFAPWISLGIDEIKRRNDIELHLIFPYGLIRTNQYFVNGNIHYHCIKTGIPLFRKNWPNKLKFNTLTNYYFFNIQVKKRVKRIDPDLINLHGAENAYYSSSILLIKNYPVLVTIQGFITLNQADESKSIEVKKRLSVEKKILKEMDHFAIEASFMGEYIKTFNPDAKMHWVHAPFAKSTIVAREQKEYDLVFFAKICQMKGIEDLIHVLAELSKWKPDISLLIMGMGDVQYIETLKGLIREIGVERNVIFKGFMPTQKAMHEEAAKARISVLPTYNDTIPGTIAESMLMGIPVISYRTGGIPDLNIKGENVILVDQGDARQLAAEIRSLLEDPGRQKELSRRAREYALTEFDNSNSIDSLIQAYKLVIEDFMTT